MRKSTRKSQGESGAYYAGEGYGSGYGGYNPGLSGYGGYGNGGYGGYGGYGDYGSEPPSRSVRDYLLIVRERFWWLVASVMVIFSGTLIYTLNTTPLYKSASSIQVLRKEDERLQFQDVVNQDVLNAEDLSTQIQILQSGNIIKRVNDRLKDDVRRRFMAPYQNVFSFTGPLTPLEVLGKYREVSPSRMSMMVSIAYIHPDKEIAAKISNLFAEEFINYNLELRVSASMRAVEDLKVRADQQRSKVEGIELNLAEFKEKYSSVSFERSTDIDQAELLELNGMRTRAERDKDEAETKWKMVQEFIDEGKDLWNLEFIARESKVSELLTRRSLVHIEKARLEQSYRSKHPKMVQASEVLAQTNRELDQAIEMTIQTNKNSYENVLKNLNNSESRLSLKKKEIIRLSKLRINFNSMVRNLDVAQEMYQYFYSRMQQTLAQTSDDSENARIVDRAFPAINPFKPIIFLNLAIGLVGGFGVGVGLVFLVAVIDDRIKTAYDIETSIGLPIIGLIPRVKSMDGGEKAQIVGKNNDKQTTEGFRTIHSTLNLGDVSKKAKCIMTTSTIPGEGKSFISSNLALTYANHGEKTILIDCDLRMPNVAKSLGLDNTMGLIGHFEDDMPIENGIVKEVFPNLDVLPSGGKSKNPTKILCSTKFENLLHELRMRYDKIVIDTPPLAPVSDAINIVPHVDGVIYVIRFNAVKRKSAKNNIKRLFESSVPIFGVVLNNISSNVASYYYSSYYDRSYKSYYINTPDLDDDEEADAKDKAKSSV